MLFCICPNNIGSCFLWRDAFHITLVAGVIRSIAIALTTVAALLRSRSAVSAAEDASQAATFASLRLARRKLSRVSATTMLMVIESREEKWRILEAACVTADGER
jgi:hypothetical protein